MPKYWLRWPMAIQTDPTTALKALLWHVIVFVVPTAVVLGPVRAIIVWIVYWFVPMLMILPIVRFVGESGKHTYDDPDDPPSTIFDATVSNVGWLHRLLFHPAGDAWHTLTPRVSDHPRLPTAPVP